MKNLKEQYIDTAQKQLNEWEQEINKLKDRVVPATSQEENELQQKILFLSKKRQKVEEKLEEIKSAGDGAWKDFRTGFQELRDDMKTSLKEVKTSLAE